MTRLRADLLLLACAAIWGFGFVFQKSVMEDLGIFTFIAARSVIAVVALAPFAMHELQRAATPLPPLFWRCAILGAVAFFIGTMLQQLGIKTASVTNTGFLTSTYIVFTPIAAWLISRIVPPRVVFAAVAVSIAGAWLLTGGSQDDMGQGEILIAASALFWATHMALMGVASVYQRPLTFPLVQFFTMGLAAALPAALLEQPSFADLQGALPELLYIGVLTSALAYAVLALALRFAQPSEAAIILGTESVFGAIAGAAVNADRLSAVSWLGASMILLAALLVQLKPSYSKS